MTAGRLALAVLPFQKIGHYLGEFSSPSAAIQPQSAVSSAQFAREVAWAVDRAAEALPFRSVCLPRAIAATQMLLLRRAPYRLHFGAQRRPGGAMLLHAWVDAQGIDVTGAAEASGFTEVGFFARAGLLVQAPSGAIEGKR